VSEAKPVVIGGRYELQERLGAGGMAEVWLAADLRLNGKKVAVKRLLGFRADSPDAADNMERVRREAFAASRVSHPNLVSVTDFVAENDEPFIVMEYVPGKTLADAAGTAGIPPGRGARAMSQVAAALADVHAAGLVHRDIKPGNILLDHRGNAKLADFGIARAKDDPRFTQTGFLTGTIAYLAPELLNGADATPASDMWSFGATLFEAMEGRRAFDGPTTPATLMAVAAAPVPRATKAGPLSDVIAALLNREPGRRPTAEQMADELTDIAAQAGAPRPPAPAPPPPPPVQFTTPARPEYAAPPQQFTPPRPQQYQATAQQGAPPPQQFTPPRPQQFTPPRPQQFTPPQPQQLTPQRPQQYTGPPHTGIHTSWPEHGPPATPTDRTAYSSGKRSSRTKILLIAAAVLVLGGAGAIIGVVASSGGGGGGSQASGPQPVFDRFVTALQGHDLNAFNATVCPQGPLTGSTQAQLNQFSSTQLVSEPNESNVGRINVTTDLAGNQAMSTYDVMMTDQNGWCVQNINAVVGGASTGSS
jgi:hypothetical protein